MKTALVIGGTGSLGDAAVALARDGWRVTVVCRSPERVPPSWGDRGIKVVQASRGEVPVLTGLVDGVDLLVDAVSYTPDQAKELGGWSHRVGSTVFISSNAVYADHSGVVDEDRQTTAWEGQSLRGVRDGYSANKAQCERVLRSEGERVSILRPGKIHGPGCRRPREWAVMKRVLDGRRLLLIPGGGTTRESTTSTLNLAQAVVACGECPGVRTVNVADRCASSVHEKVQAIVDAMSRLAASSGPVRLVPGPVEGPGNLPWFADKILSVDAFSALIGSQPASYEETVEREIAWLLAELKRSGDERELPRWMDRAFFESAFDYEAEDAELERLGKSTDLASPA